MGGTVLTVGPQGTIENGTVLVRDGKILAVGRDVAVPAGAVVIDAKGRFVMPGIIDAHSHTAIEGSVNECTDVITAEVRVGDVIDHRDVDIYRQLAGGVTAINVLHGSCNAIGGQNAVLKLRWGKAPGGPGLQGGPARDQVRPRRERQALELQRPRRGAALPRHAHGRRGRAARGLPAAPGPTSRSGRTTRRR